MTANTPQTRKAKGNRLERKVAELYRQYDIDAKATRMPMSGAMSHFKGDIWKPADYKYVDECKNSEKVRFWEYWNQAEAQSSLGRVPLLHVSANNRPILTVMDAHTYFDLRKTIIDLEKELAELKAIQE